MPPQKTLSFKKVFSFKKTPTVGVGAAPAAAPAAATPAEPAKPPPAKPPPADPAPADTYEEKQYELEVPPNTLPGAKLKLTIPGMAEKVVITVPEGAVPGATISFSLPKKKSAGDAAGADPSAEKAAVMIQARVRGFEHRKKVTKMKLDKQAVVVAAPDSAADVTDAVIAEPAEPLFQPAPGLVSDTGTAPKKVEFDDEPASTPSKAAAPRLGGMGSMVKRSLGNLLSVFSSQTTLPPAPAEAMLAVELTRVASTAIAAWEEADFDAFAAMCGKSIIISIPGFTDHSMQGVWQARMDDDHAAGIYSLDTVMVQLDDEDNATLVGLLHVHDTEANGMVIKHQWVRMYFAKAPDGVADPAADAATARGLALSAWKLTEVNFDAIWPKAPAEDDAPSDDRVRLGLSRTLNKCTDVMSLCSVLFTAWLAGDKNRFEAVADPELAVSMKALGVIAKSAADAYGERAKLLEYGNLLAFNSPMVDSESSPSEMKVLAHAHLYDVTDDDARAQPTVHLALGIMLSLKGDSLYVSKIVADVIWMGEGATPDTEGLSFESSPLQSIYTRALTFVKAWETSATDGLAALTTKSVKLEVPLRTVDSVGQDALLAYRETVGSLGMITLDSIRVTPTRFEANLHEYGIEPAQHGLPIMHAPIKIDFEAQRDGSVLISRFYMNIEYIRIARRASITSAPLNEALNLAAEL